jgi:hypothetical protein
VRRHSPALGLFVLITLVLAFPVIRIMLRGGVPGWEGDNLYYVHGLWWWKHALFDLHTSPFFDPDSFVPAGKSVLRGELTSTTMIAALPITGLLGAPVAYNVMILVSFVATAFFTYLWVTELSESRAAGLVAGTVAGFLPYRFAHMAGHLPEMSTYWVPLTLYGFERFLKQQSLTLGLFLGVAVALTVLGCWYYGYALTLMFPVYALVRTRGRRVWRTRPWWAGLAVAATAALVLLAPFLRAMTALRGQDTLRRTLGAMDYWSLNPYDLVIPNLMHPLWGAAASRWFPVQHLQWVERGVTLGIVAVVLAIAGTVAGRRRDVVLALGTTWLAASIVALGPTLHWRDQQVRVHLGAHVTALAQRALSGTGGDTDAVRASLAQDGVPIPLPALLMYKVVPLTKSMRVMARFALWSGFMTAALAGLGVLALCRRFGLSLRPIALTVTVLVAFESLAVIPVMTLEPRPVDQWLASQPRSTVIVELPVDQAERPLQDYWMTVNQKPNLFGWVADSFDPPLQLEREQTLKDFPAPSSIAYLRQSPATLVLVTPSQIPAWTAMQPVLDGAAGLTFLRQIGEVRVYRINR